MAFKKQFTCGCDVQDCPAEAVVWATGELSALRELLKKNWKIVYVKTIDYNYMYCTKHLNVEPPKY